MDKIYNQIFDKIVVNLKNPELTTKINQHLINPLMKKIQLNIYNYLVIFILLYSLIILLLMIIISIIINKNYLLK